MGNNVLLLLIAAAIPILCSKMDVYPASIPKIIFKPHKAHYDGLFGYSVAYHNSPSRKSLIVGAPKGSPTGDIHNCDIYRGKCTIMKVNGARPTVGNDSHWLGATVGASPSFIVGCAPRIRTYLEASKEGMFGGCYYQRNSDLNLANQVPTKKIIDELVKNFDENDKVRWGNTRTRDIKKGILPIEFAMTSFGWSMHVTREEKVLVGGPAMMFGRAMVYDDDETYPELIMLDNNELKKTNANIEHNFGYAVVSGKFFNDEIDYAVSSTYGDIGNGKILFFTSSKLQYKGVAILDSQPGAMFGAALCSGHLKGPYETLLVGAPARVEASRQLGAVHIYVGRGKQMQEKRTLWGYKENSFFGSAIANLGDMNGDKEDDIAVAAPYEDGGAVYIYSGSDLSGNAPTVQRIAYMQRITYNAVAQTSPLLPISLTVLDDYDENGCNELAIGIPMNNEVQLLRCPAFIVIDLVSELPEQLDLNRMNFDFKLCLKVTFGTKSKYIETILEMQIKVSSNVEIADKDRAYTIDLDVTKIQHCKPIPVSLLKDADYDTPITFDVSVAARNPTKEFNERQVIISDLSKTTLQERLMAPGSNLQLEVTTTLTDNYIIGSTSEEHIQVLLSNHGRVAHHACVRGLVTGACPKSVSEHCDLKGNEFVCKLKDLFRNGESKKYDIILDTKKMTSAAMNVQIVTKLYRVCDGEEYNTTIKQLYLKTDRRINILGTSTQPLNVTKMEFKYGDQIVKHLYTITNNGITKWENVTCQISMPPGCSVSISDHECDTKKNPATCTISKIDRNDTVSVVVMFTVLPGATIGKYPGKAIASNLILGLGTETISLSVRTPINLRERAVAIWIIVVASIMGLLLLLIFALILRECGCFRRKNKEKLEKLKEVKKRESVMPSVRNSAMPKLAEDRQTLVRVPEYDEFNNEKSAPAHDSDPGYSEPPKPVTTNADIYRT